MQSPAEKGQVGMPQLLLELSSYWRDDESTPTQGVHWNRLPTLYLSSLQLKAYSHSLTAAISLCDGYKSDQDDYLRRRRMSSLYGAEHTLSCFLPTPPSF